MNEYLFTSESVSEGHPDKVADQISDAILDALLAQDKYARVAAETLVNTGLVVLAGEVTSNARVDYIKIARNTVKEIRVVIKSLVNWQLAPTGGLSNNHSQVAKHSTGNKLVRGLIGLY